MSLENEPPMASLPEVMDLIARNPETLDGTWESMDDAQLLEEIARYRHALRVCTEKLVEQGIRTIFVYVWRMGNSRGRKTSFLNLEEW